MADFLHYRVLVSGFVPRAGCQSGWHFCPGIEPLELRAGIRITKDMLVSEEFKKTGQGEEL